MKNTRKMIYAAICLALCMMLPLLTGQIPQIGSSILPMHIPVLICGFVCGWPLGAAIGFAAPALRYLIFGMPPIFPVGAAMMFELAAYGLVSGLLYKLLPKKNVLIYPVLIGAMISGRIVWGAAMLIFTSIQGSAFTWPMFMSGAVINAVPGIIIHILLIPPVIMALKRAGYTE